MTESVFNTGTVMGLDPSSRITGYAVMDSPSNIVEGGYISGRPMSNQPGDRIQQIVRDVKDLLDLWVPRRVVIEMPSGKVHTGRHKGGGAGLSVYGWACGAIWQVARDFYGPVSGVVAPDEIDWTNSVPKRMRQAAVSAAFPAYHQHISRDTGGDVADAIGLCLWWFQEESIRRGLTPGE